MSVNGVTSGQSAATYTNYGKDNTVKTDTAAKGTTASKAEDTGVIYEPSKEAAKSSTKKVYKQDINVINKLKADADARTQQLRDLINKMMNQQTNKYGKANNIFEFLAKGDYNVDPATRLQAQADIAEDGYWGVSQTSSRILDFATALTGGDPSKIEEMRSAFEKGFKMAEKTWGGKLPDISQRTYEAVMAGFDSMAKPSEDTTVVE